MKQEIEELKNKIIELEQKYLFNEDYRLICALLNKLNFDTITLTKEEIENNTTMFILDRQIDDKITIFRYECEKEGSNDDQINNN